MNKNKGFTAIELMIVIAIIGIVTSLAVPAFGIMMQRNKLKSAIQSFQDDLQHARILAVKKSQNVLINRTQTSTTVGDWCYGLSTKAACICTVTDTAAANFCEIKIISGTNFSTVSMLTATGNSSFDFKRGTIGANGVTFYTTNYAARVVFDNVGRVRICTPPTVSNTVAAANRPIGTGGLPVIPDCT